MDTNTLEKHFISGVGWGVDLFPTRPIFSVYFHEKGKVKFIGPLLFYAGEFSAQRG